MGANDFLDGRITSNFANRRAMADADDAIADWQNFSTRLQGRLQRSELEFARAEAGRIGFAHLFKTVLDELRRVDPTNRLLDRNLQLKILGAKVSEKAAEMGYLYDPNTGSVVDKPR